MKILIIDDEPDVVEALTLAFSLQWPDTQVLASFDGESGLNQFFEKNPEVVILDIVMPGMSGFEILRRIREVSDVPVLMLTVKDAEMDKVKALELGADDYITKPFGALELMARIRAVLRRMGLPMPTSTFTCADLTIDFTSREVTVRGQPVKLTPREYNLLVYLARHANHVIPRETLLSRVWGDEYRNDWDSLKVYIRRLRRKVEADPDSPCYILTERGVGYRLANLPR